MTSYTRRQTLQLLSSLAAGSMIYCNPTLLAQSAESKPPLDWSQAIVDSTMSRIPEPARLGRWGYAVSLFLYGTYLVYQRTREQRLLIYIQGWVDSHVNAAGQIDRSITALDYILPGNLLLVLYKETDQQKYRTAADAIRDTFGTYPRTSDGGLWHAYSRQHQLWLDGMYMSMPFLVRYGLAFHDSHYAFDEAANQLLIYARHLNDSTSGLLFHAYDESGKQPWADPKTHHSSIFWCRSIGWYGMALIEVLEHMPRHHRHRKQLVALVAQLCKTYRDYQDPASGLWYQVVDKGSDARNWLETSSSCMFTYTLSKAVEHGYVPEEYKEPACKGFRGVQTQLSTDSEGHAHIANICIGTNVGDLQYYFDRPRRSDDFHGLGAFLLMNEQLRKTRC